MAMSPCKKLQILLRNRNISKRYSSGYLVLLPEIAPTLPDRNPLLKDGLPVFTDISSENVKNTLGKYLLEFEHEVFTIDAQLKASAADNIQGSFIETVVQPLQKPAIALNTTWGIVKALFLSDRENFNLNTFVNLQNRVHKAMYSRYSNKEIFQTAKVCDTSKLSEEEMRVVEKYQLEGRLSGLHLDADNKDSLDLTISNLRKEKNDFNKRVQLSKDLFYTTIHDPYVVRGFPPSLLEAVAQDREDPGRGPWVVTTEPVIRDRVLEYCPDKNFRSKIWTASYQVASVECGNTELSNSACLEKIRSLRQDQASILGFANFAEMSMETKMASNLDIVFGVLETFRQAAVPAQEKELEKLQSFADESGFGGKVDLSDVLYWSRKQKMSLFNFEKEEIRDYFPLEKVFKGLTDLCSRLFNIRIEHSEVVSTWHPDAKFYYIFEGDSTVPTAGFYFDPYSRKTKAQSREHGWLIGMRPAHHGASGLPISLPLGALILTVRPPLYGKPSLLSFDQVEFIFAKFGMLLQQLLCTVTFTEVSGLSNVEWDAVEITSNFMKHWLYDTEVLASISGHYDTGAPVPIKDLHLIPKHLAGTNLSHELYRANLDLKLHTEKAFWTDVLEEIWTQHIIHPLPKVYFEPLSWLDTVTGEWAAAYYGHIWSKMIAADAFSAFKEEGVDLVSTGTRFRDTYLAFGGGCDPHEVFRRFRGRDPSPEVYLKYLGLL